MANKRKIPKYFAIRIFLIPLMIHFLLVFPISGIMLLKNVPDLFQKYKTLEKEDTLKSTTVKSDTISISQVLKGSDTIAQCDTVNCKLHQQGLTLNIGKNEQSLGFSFSNNNKSLHKDSTDGHLSMWVALIGLIIGFAFNYPFRRYFNRKRKNKSVSEKLLKYCRKYLQYTPLVNSLIFAVGFFIIHIHSIIILHSAEFSDKLEHNLFRNWFYISIASSVLTVLFVYLWQKYRLEFKYIEHTYDEESLHKNIYKTGKTHSLKFRLWLISIMTTVLPLVIVLFYAFLSVSTVKDIGLQSLTKDQLHLLLGKFYAIVQNTDAFGDTSTYLWLPFVSSVDVFLAFAGIQASIIAAIIYIFFVVNWTNKSISLPVKELMLNMKKTGEGQITNFIPVRTNDEMGALTEGYNDMTQKIDNYIEEISAMNRDLEQKVIDRTREVVQQKEEIETQRDEILEKNEELVQQKEEIISQKDEIERQKKVVDDQHTNITDSIRYALRIQRTILPSDELMMHLLPDSFIFYKPKDIVSGDFYWLAEKNDKIYFAAVDCTGHGVPGALMSIVAHNLLNQAMDEASIEKPSEILDFISLKIVKNLRGNTFDEGVNDGMDLVVCMLDKQQQILQFSGVHNPLYIVSQRNMQVYRTNATSLGDFDNDFKGYTNHEIAVTKGDQIYLFSDGFADQFGGNNKRFTSKKFRETLFELHSLQSHEQKEMLSRIFEYWRSSFEQTDDVLVFGVRI